MTDKNDSRTHERLAQLGRNIRRTRRNLGISRAKLATTIGMHPMNYAKIEQGKQNVTIDTLLRIADGLGVELVVRLKTPKASGTKQ
ncbi:MAG TPA: helix-turn-helix transcriptional regulator [Acidimicrobiales bacterium]|nr:helix-turn-helix transcriptional regulator [Acidimicrobiales bacterium]